MTNPPDSFLPEKERPLSAKIIGVGGAGANAVAQMEQGGLGDLQFAVVHTNPRALSASSIAEKVLLGAGRTRGMGSGGDPALGKSLAEAETDRLKALCADTDLIFLVAGLGGGTGTGVTPVLAKIAKESRALVLGLVAFPFEFEGPRRAKQAQEGFLALKAAADAVIFLPNQKMLQLLDENTSLVEAFKHTNELLTQAVRGIWQMVTRPGLIRVDFAYLYSVIRGGHAESAFATAEARGEARTREVVEKLLASPLLDDGRILEQADDVLVSLLGGHDLTIAEVNKIMEQLNRKIGKGQIIMGAALDENYKGRISLTLVASRNAEKPAFEAEGEEEPAQAAPQPSNRIAASAPVEETPDGEEMNSNIFESDTGQKSASRYVPPPPSISPEKTEALLNRQNGRQSRLRRARSKMKQGQLALEIISRGRFEKSEPTIYHGEDLDVPTYIRRGMPLN